MSSTVLALAELEMLKPGSPAVVSAGVFLDSSLGIWAPGSLGQIAFAVGLATLVCALVVIVALAVVARGRRARRRIVGQPVAPPPAPPPPEVAPPPRMTATPVSGQRQAAVAPTGLAMASTPTAAPARLACPACRREYEATVRFCPYDSRRLVPAGELAARGRAGGTLCPRCRRSYDSGARVCPHDGEELMPAALWPSARARRADPALTGIVAKLCPRCGASYDLSTTLCTKDGAELVTVN